MLLTADIGNTNIVIGVFKGGRVVRKMRIPSDALKSGGWYAKKLAINGIDRAIIASVVPQLTAKIAGAIKKACGCGVKTVNWKMIREIKIDVPEKSQVGIDRLVNAVAASGLYGGKLVIIDFGTATTFCAVDRGRYLGGAITSGLEISKIVLHEKTAKLPLISIEKPRKAIGRDTVSAMRSGLFYGYIDLVEGMIKRFKKELGGKPKVIATGGLSGMISKGTRMIDVVDQDLTLKGLKIISDDLGRDK